MEHQKTNKLNLPRILLYLLGMLFLAIGLTLNTRVTLGVSAILSVAYCISELTGVNIGNATLAFYVLFIAVEVILHLLRKSPDWKRVILFDVLQLPLSLVFTRFMNLFTRLIPVFETACAGTFWGSVWGRALLLLLAIAVTGTGAALTLKMRLIPNPGDGIVQALADFFHKKVGTMKNALDLCCVIFSAALALCLVHRIIGIGVGTVMAALLTGRVVALVNRLFGEKLDAVCAGPDAIANQNKSSYLTEGPMKIAVSYENENGMVFQHFGHTEQFKVYEIEDGRPVSAELLRAGGTGHEALATLLKDHGVDVLICGGIGGGAQAALSEAGIELCAGAAGDADKAVAAYLRGELVDTGVNCDHHDGEHACGGHEEGAGCGGGCGSCGGCHSAPAFEGKNVGKTCRTHYRGTFNDGTQFDSSYDRGEPLEFICGAGMMIRGFDEAVANMEVGETVQVHLSPAEAYGEADPNAIFTVELAELPGAEAVSVGERVYLQDACGRHVPVLVVAKDAKTITFDANHEMAGKELNFTIELVEVLG